MKSNHEIKISVSVVVPVYNVEKYLQRCVKSLINQDFTCYEIILVDDGSTDSSGKICDDFAHNNNAVKVIHKENGGLSSARLAGYKEACGEYICFIDSDDYLKKSYISDLYNCIVKHNAEMSICAYSYEKNGKQIDHFLPNYIDSCITNISEDFVLPIVSEGNIYSCKMLPNYMWMRMIKKDIISEDLFVSERAVYQEDLVFNLLISNKLNCISLINNPNYIYCHNGASLTEKYRDNAWQMQINLYNAVSQYCHKNRYEVDDSLTERLVNAVLFTVRNAAKSDYSIFVHDICQMKQDNMYHTARKKFKYLKHSNKQCFIFLCLSLNLHRILYKVLK